MHVSLVFKLCLHQTRASNDLKETVDLSKKSHFVQGLRHNRVAFEFKLRSGIRCESNRAAVCEQNTMNETSVCTNIALSFALALGLFLQPYMCWPAVENKGAKIFRKSQKSKIWYEMGGLPHTLHAKVFLDYLEFRQGCSQLAFVPKQEYAFRCSCSDLSVRKEGKR